MIKYLAMEATRKLNFFPPKGGVSKYYSPQEILHQVRIDYKKQCSIPQFSYIQAHDEPIPKNGQAPQTIDCIYLHPLCNIQGRHELMNLAMGQMITSNIVMPVPMMQAVITAVEEMAKNEGMKGLRL
jgi:hypothetical protein